MNNWFNIPRPEVSWLVDGLIPADGHTAICGKPKAGKSTFIRNLIVAVVKNRKFLDRSIDIPEGSGRVLYVHLDRKDQDWRVANELRELGITESESDRIRLKNATDMPDESDDRFMWLQKSIVESNPNLIVIDLLMQFLNVQNPNDYAQVLKGINKLQDSLKQCGYKGALVVAIHGRKAVNPDQPFDDMLGSTGQRGSFSTNIMLTQRRKEGVYTVMSDQTERDDCYGEMQETILNRRSDGVLEFGVTIDNLQKQTKKEALDNEVVRLLQYIDEHPKCEIDGIMEALGISKKKALDLLDEGKNLIEKSGRGVKGDPYRYASPEYSEKKAQDAAVAQVTGNLHMHACHQQASQSLPDAIGQ